jgi:hypothetical protein
VVGTIAYAALPLGLYCWRRLTARQRWALLIILGAEILCWVGKGTNKGIFDLLLVCPWVVLASFAGTGVRLPTGKLVRFAAIVAVLVCLALAYFAVGSYGRRVAAGSVYYGLRVAGHEPDYANAMVAQSPSRMTPLILGLSAYLTQGYYFLGLAFEEPYHCGYGIGNSYFLQNALRRFINTQSISDRSYPGKLEYRYGLDRYAFWHSAYTWIASDLTFPGTLVFVFAVGWLLGTVWRDAIAEQSASAVVLLHLLMTMVIYLPANNQVLGFSSFVPFVVYLGLWCRGRYMRAVPRLRW